MEYQNIRGATMGTSYSVVYQSNLSIQNLVDSLLVSINDQVSTYISDSDISDFNNSHREYRIKHERNHFRVNWEKSKTVSARTDGYFDPTVMPLINYWGFGYQEKVAQNDADSTKIDSLMVFVGMDKIEEVQNILLKKHPGVQLDFSAIAKGYAVDEVARRLNNIGIDNYLVEIGGESFTKGKNPSGDKWRLGVNTPKEDAALNDFEMVVSISDVGIASSGNYRNFYVVNGKKYGHTVDPKTGYPSLNELLGVTVIASDCTTADAYATGFMAMGLSKAIELAEELKNLEACFFTSDDIGNIKKTYTNGFVQYIGAE